MWVLSLAPEGVAGFEGEEGYGEGGLRVGDCAGLFQEFHLDTVFGVGFVRVSGEADRDVEAADCDAVL